ncbi:unnamed protein product [Heligmosomoides polygyrus]|uniref:VASP_tetra domain-containing protein n=1 Tax=Heligmosomoides polygyrus TaxID=6339 RepID=A0A183G0K9_HELPZ|nr:unnamed protein product [Heligmosomoides polygyrus]
MDSLLESPTKSSVSGDVQEKNTFTFTSQQVSTHSTNREVTSPPGFTAPPAPQVKTQPLRPPPPELKLEEKKESASGAKSSASSLLVSPTLPLSNAADSEFVSRKEYNELLARLASMEARITLLEKR